MAAMLLLFLVPTVGWVPADGCAGGAPRREAPPRHLELVREELGRPFYPPGTKPADMLAFYATQFPTVEADTTYYRIPPREMVRGWRTRTPDGFVVSAKFPRSVVHGGEGMKPDATKVLEWSAVGGDVERFLDAMGELGKKQGPLVVQLPYLNRSAFASVEPFPRAARGVPRSPAEGPRYGVEVRNKGWIGEALLGLLRKRNVALVLVDIVYAAPRGLREGSSTSSPRTSCTRA
jgi:uncharacterized protein YecE (DUF72 family)